MTESALAATSPNLSLARKLKFVIAVVTILVWALVGLMRRPEKIPLPEGMDLSGLPMVNAIINSVVAVLLVVGLVMIKKGNVEAHKRAISAAMICSALFLVSYVAYHFTNQETRFGGEGIVRIAYYAVLISHIVLAAVSLPFILMTWMYSYTGQFEKHRGLAKWVFPIWLYVAVSGPVCYLMLRPYY